MISLKDIRSAQHRLRGVIRATPTVFSELSSREAGLDVYLKLENLQKTGSFKIRGAYNKMARLASEQLERGVITASAGNHAQGVARAAAVFKAPCTVVMPEHCSISKYNATRALGAEVILSGAKFDEAKGHALEVARERGFTFIDGFNDPAVMAGQGTIGLELLSALPDLDMVLAPIGGGGLFAGIATAVKELRPKVKVVGVQAANVSTVAPSLKRGKPVKVRSVHTIADGIAVHAVGDMTFPVIQKYLDDVVTVNEREIAAAILFLMEGEKIVVEGAGAVSLAALLNNKVKRAGNRVCAVLSGGNIDLNMVERIIEKGLLQDGRLMRMEVEIDDTPGSLVGLLSLLAAERGNILQIYHDRMRKEASLVQAKVEIDLETRGEAHLKRILRLLKDNGYHTKLLP
jgi:threonine dehydratase